MSKKKKPAAQGKSGQPAKPGAQKSFAPHSSVVVRRPPRHQGR